jgi:hypothetical protein
LSIAFRRAWNRLGEVAVQYQIGRRRARQQRGDFFYALAHLASQRRSFHRHHGAFVAVDNFADGDFASQRL